MKENKKDLKYKEFVLVDFEIVQLFSIEFVEDYLKAPVKMEIFHAFYHQFDRELYLNNNMFEEYLYHVEMNV